MSPLFRIAAGVLYTVSITLSSLASSSSLDELSLGIPFEDKLAHMGMYGLQAAILMWILELRGISPAKTGRTLHALTAFVFCTGYGALMEWCQLTMTSGDRQFETGDVAANMIGALLAVIAVRLIELRRSCAVPRTPADADREA